MYKHKLPQMMVSPARGRGEAADKMAPSWGLWSRTDLGALQHFKASFSKRMADATRYSTITSGRFL